ncbi:MAG: MBL fold metallo-hydrolase [SAR86 cluster bacterium]|uniref:MBL fold metallo-hydrolase n=1 Tax=SAR86 cluster bacterium TaxID=2030880 RepID=A0A520N4R8_9GAMM|nr:MAG: MBL fold metallo-hydrolase [SAR86 cluster bacterium]
MFKRHLILLLSTILVSCSKPSSYDIEVPITSEVEKLIQHTSEFDKQVLSYETSGGKIHFAIGFGIANSIMVEGDKGNIIIDASDSVFEAEKIYSLFSQKNSNPIKAIIYTHNHGDHTFGTAFYVNNQDEKPQIIAHEDTDYYVQRIMGILNPIITERSNRMFGTLLSDEDLINVGIGPSLNVAKSPTGYIKPNVTFKDYLELDIAGIKIELFHAPGETNDQLFVWLPEHKALLPGDNVYKTFPNLYTIRGTTHRDVVGWVNSIDHMKNFDAEYLFPSHTKPIIGKENIEEILTIYRDAIQYIHDQTIRLMNEGLYPDQIAELIKLPEHIANSPYLYEFYGTVRWSVKSIFNGYLGWFSGNPSELDPLSRKERAIRMSKLAGGDKALLEQLYSAVENEDMQWALELSDHLITLDYFIDDVKDLRKKALIYEGSRSSNPNKRNYFLTAALELNESFEKNILIERTEELLEQISIDTLFSVLSVRFNPEKTNEELTACFNFSSGISKNIDIRNDVAVVSDIKQQECNLYIQTDEIEFKKILVGLESPISSLASGKIEIEGGSTQFLQFLSMFR